LRHILDLEEQGDWEGVETASLELIGAITDGRSEQVPDEVYHFIDDFDVRRKDSRYAAGQHKIVKAYLGGG
jgi:hypothetical protein